MTLLGKSAGLLASPVFYRLWQQPFARAKFAPFWRHNAIAPDAAARRSPGAARRRILDLGCGPGTNARFFTADDYWGLDLSPEYIADARRRYPGNFVVGDARHPTEHVAGAFDLVLVNSLLHHFDDADTRQALAGVRPLLGADATVHVFELVLPENRSVARYLARSDRGCFARPLERWRELLVEAFEPLVFEPYPLGGAGCTLWHMVYFKGKVRA